VLSAKLNVKAIAFWPQSRSDLHAGTTRNPLRVVQQLTGTVTMDHLLAALQHAEAAVEAYTELSGAHGGAGCDLVDLVTDLLHFARDRDLDPLSIIIQAQEHFSSEAAPQRSG
jgi:hypothetical protein